MENYSLSTITRDQLLNFLKTARYEMAKWARCCEEVERCENRTKVENKEKEGIVGEYTGYKYSSIVLLGVVVIMTIMEKTSTALFAVLVLLLIIIGGCFIVSYFRHSGRVKKIQNYIYKLNTELTELDKKEKETFDKFFAIIEPYQFPRDYWYEYAINTMVEFVERRQADNWKEVVNLYEDHLYKKRMEENARKTLDATRQTLDEIRKQTEISIQTRNAARWAAAGIWLR